MKMYSSFNNNLEVNEENIKNEINKLKQKEDNFLVLIKDNLNTIQCFCYNKKYGFYQIEKMIDGKWFKVEISTQLSTTRAFIKFSQNKLYKVIKAWRKFNPKIIKEVK